MNRRAFFLPHLSCPRKCIYCDQRAITGETSIPDPREITDILKTITSEVEICYFGGSFTCLPRELQKAYLETIYAAPPNSKVRFSTHPLCIDEDILQFLSAYPVSMIELGVSSLEDHVLTTCRRGYSGREVLDRLSLIHARGFRSGAQLMIGLPGQSVQSSMKDLEKLASLSDGGEITLRIYPCLVLDGTQLSTMLDQGNYKPLSVEQAAEWAGLMLHRAEALGFPVQRIGLQETESLAKSFIAGPHHPALGEMARAESLILSLLEAKPYGPWIVSSNKRSLLFGHNRYGLKRLLERTGLSEKEIEGVIRFS